MELAGTEVMSQDQHSSAVGVRALHGNTPSTPLHTLQCSTQTAAGQDKREHPRALTARDGLEAGKMHLRETPGEAAGVI